MDGAHGGNGRDAVPDDGVAGDLEEGLGDVEGEGTEASAAGGTTDLEGRRHVRIGFAGLVRWCFLSWSLGIGRWPWRESRGELTRITALVEPSLGRWGTWSDMSACEGGCERLGRWDGGGESREVLLHQTKNLVLPTKRMRANDDTKEIKEVGGGVGGGAELFSQFTITVTDLLA